MASYHFQIHLAATVVLCLSFPVITSENLDNTKHAVDCIQSIASQYFIGSDSLTVVIPLFLEDATRNDFSLESNEGAYKLLPKLHALTTLPLSVIRPSIMAKVSLKSDVYRKETNYVIILRDTCKLLMKEIILILRGNMQSITFLPSWNSRARFIVVVTTEDCGPDTEEIALNIVEELWTWKVLNVVVVTPTSEPFRSQQISHIQEDHKEVPVLDLFTFAPFKTSINLWKRVQSVFLIDQWSSFSRFLHNRHLFPSKVPHNLKGCPITVSTIVYEPFVLDPDVIPNDKNSTVLRYKDGFEIRLLRLIGSAINASLVFRPPPDNGELWGRNLLNGTWTGIRGDVVHGKSDVALCAIVVTSENSVVMDPTVTYMRGGFVWVVPHPETFPRWLSVFRVFKLFAWLCIIVTILLASVIMWRLSRTPINREDAKRTMSANIFDAWAVILGISVPEMPRCLHIRIFFIFWVIYCLAVNTVFQAFLTSFLIDPGLLPPIMNLDELLDSGIEYGYHPLMDRYLDSDNEKHREILHNHKICLNTTACLERVAVKGDFAHFLSRQVMDYTSYYKFQDANGDSLIQPFNEDFVQYNIAMYLTKGSPFLDRFNDIIAHAMQAGLLDLWYNNEIYWAKLSAHKISEIAADDGYSALSKVHIQGAIFLYGIGNVFGVLVFVFEIFYRSFIANVRFKRTGVI
ncbi:hypothetical protein L798_15790 [Zootermopsis nevadensis]|uniref:Ionotropic glutamate receptor L-glutamate and glycine-binding domain-containing protein n=1 Tax=Zootermopsis nevadensis TaxID=136037 RepID=A0A067QL33_ZOONE|nr:hypothetical protein L798_15790 [Zootermopsis nevadensis]